jgi:hypothetical protein
MPDNALIKKMKLKASPVNQKCYKPDQFPETSLLNAGCRLRS